MPSFLSFTGGSKVSRSGLESVEDNLGIQPGSSQSEGDEQDLMGLLLAGLVFELVLCTSLIVGTSRNGGKLLVNTNQQKFSCEMMAFTAR